MKKVTSITLVLLFTLAFFSCKSDKKEKQTVENQAKETKLEVSGKFNLSQNESIVNWAGSKPTGKHNGEIKIKSGEMILEDGKLVSGKFVVDMTSLNVKDLEGDEKNELENHLKGNIKGKEDHFFNVKKFPESRFVIKSVEKTGDSNKIYGELTIKGISNAIDFNAKISVGNNNQAVKLISEEFNIDRTNWGIEFMSKSVFDDLKDKFISDDIQLQVSLKAIK